MDFELRKWQTGDINSVAKYANNKTIANNLRNAFPYPYTREDAAFYVNDCLKKGDEKQLLYAIAANGEAIGSIGIFVKDDVYCKSAELGYWLAEPFWGRGIMTKAVKEICTLAFEKYDIVRIFAEPYAHNTGSRKVLEKAGFVLEGTLKNSVYKNGELFDSCMYALLKE